MRFADYALGTTVSIDVRPGDCGHASASRALRRARGRLHRADEIFSTWKPDSPMSRLRRDEITLAQAPPEVAEVLWRCADARRLSEGWFDPWNTLGGLDPAGLLRGWAVGGALDVLRGAGVSAALIDAGGVVAAFGAPTPGRAWRVPVPGAEPPGHPCAMVEVSGSVATVVEGRRGTSAPHRGRPAGRNLRSVTVAGPDPVLAEALAVAVLSAGAGGGR